MSKPIIYQIKSNTTDTNPNFRLPRQHKPNGPIITPTKKDIKIHKRKIRKHESIPTPSH